MPPSGQTWGDIVGLTEDLLTEAPPLSSKIEEEPEYLWGLQRELVRVPPPEQALRPAITVEESRARIRAALAEYLATENPEHMLLIKALPGVGKTTAAVAAAEELAAAGKRVLYAGPRHAFFADVMALSSCPSLWYEWLPRQEENEAAGKPETCRHNEAMADWLRRGYPAIEFCQKVCGWDYVNDECPYHAQKRRPEPCIFGQHQHVVVGHPLEFHVVIGDEYPVPAFCRPWRIPARWIMPSGMDPRGAMSEIMHTLHTKAGQDVRLQGRDLMNALGGAAYVRSAAEECAALGDLMVLPPDIHRPEDVEEVDYAHLPALAGLLVREADAALAGGDYPARVALIGHSRPGQDQPGGHLTLFMRHEVNDHLPAHLVWLDATANQRLYATAFQREVQVVDAQPGLRARIYQVTDRANGKASLLTRDGAPTAKAEQLAQQVGRIVATGGYERPAVISYKGLVDGVAGLNALDHVHFYAARGTNALEDCDTLIVAGTPQPPLGGIENVAKMIYFERMTPFVTKFSSREVPYAYVDEHGDGWAYPSSGFWGDADLHSVLWSMREAEIVQAAHRSRPVHRDVDIWLLTNLPMDDLPPTRLLDIRALFGAPEAVNAYTWPAVLAVAEQYAQAFGDVNSSDLARELGLDPRTARKYIGTLLAQEGWVAVDAPSAARPPKRGRPSLAVRPRKPLDIV